MTWPTEQAREAVAQVRELRFGLAFGLPGDVSPDVVHDAILAALAALVRAERADAWEEGYDVGHRYARGVLPPDESDANPYTEEAGR